MATKKFSPKKGDTLNEIGKKAKQAGKPVVFMPHGGTIRYIEIEDNYFHLPKAMRAVLTDLDTDTLKRMTITDADAPGSWFLRKPVEDNGDLLL